MVRVVLASLTAGADFIKYDRASIPTSYIGHGIELRDWETIAGRAGK